MRIGAIILAAGYSSRMGELKALMPLGGQTILERVVALFRQANIPNIIVVSGYEHERITSRLAGSGEKIVYNPCFADGMLSSVQSGLTSLNRETDAFFLMPVDIPLVDVDTLTTLVKAYQAAGLEAVVHPCYRGLRGHPPLIPARCIQAILEWEGNHGLRGLWQQSPLEQINVEVNDENILFDIDTPAEYQLLIEKFARRSLHDTERLRKE